jgi:hypothetical protein
MSEVERGRGVWCGVRRSGRGRMWERLIQASARSEREGWDEKEGALQSADVCRVGPVAGVTMRLAGQFATTLARPPCRLPVSRPDERVCALPAARCPLPTTAQPRMQPRCCCCCCCRCPGLGGPGAVAGRWSLVALAVAAAGAGSRPTASLHPRPLPRPLRALAEAPPRSNRAYALPHATAARQHTASSDWRVTTQVSP